MRKLDHLSSSGDSITKSCNLPHDRLSDSSIPNCLLLGLTGLDAEFRDNGDASTTFSDAEAARATRYAINEINGYPFWFLRLIQSHPDAVIPILAGCVNAEWAWPPTMKHPQGVVSKLVWGGEGIREYLRTHLIALLSESDPAHPEVLRAVLRLLLSKKLNAVAELRPLVEARAKRYAPGDTPWFIWMRAWLEIDSIPAITYLEEVLSAAGNGTVLTVGLCNSLEGERERGLPQLENPSFMETEALARLILLIFAHVRVTDDVRHVGPYTPTSRDDAERVRNALLTRLAESDDPAATYVVGILRANPLFQHPPFMIRWLNNLYEKRIITRSEQSPWTEADVRDYEATFEREPRNDQDLYNLTCHRFRDLSDSLDAAERSERTDIRRNDREDIIRRWIARKLVEKSLSRYTVHEETEIDLDRFPDIRVEKPGLHPVSIEVKKAENYTITQLLERLENQLVGTYLRPRSLRFGIYVLAYLGEQGRWRKDDGTSMNFPQLVSLVQARADAICSQAPGEIVLKVVSLNFAAPILP